MYGSDWHLWNAGRRVPWRNRLIVYAVAAALTGLIGLVGWLFF